MPRRKGSGGGEGFSLGSCLDSSADFEDSGWTMGTYPKPSTDTSKRRKTGGLLCLDDYVMTEILLRLPPRSLGRSRSVCRRWRSITTSPYFLARFSFSGLFLTPYSTNQPTSFVPLSGGGGRLLLPDPALHFVRRAGMSPFALDDSCNGLMLTRASFPRHAPVLVFNPVTCRASAIPWPPKPIARNILREFLAFDPSRSPYYTVVLIASPDLTHFKLYSSRTRSWALSPPLLDHDGDFGTQVGRPAFWEGALHWHHVHGYIFSFHPEECTAWRTLLPVDEKQRPYAYFGSSSGNFFWVSGYNTNRLRYDVWRMQGSRESSSWSLRHSINLEKIKDLFPGAEGSFLSFNLLHLDCTGEEEELLIQEPNMILRYGIRSRAFHKMCDATSLALTAPLGSTAEVAASWEKATPLESTVLPYISTLVSP